MKGEAMGSLSSKAKVVIVGGVAGGANAAARLRRLNESVEIIIFERGGYVSFANCGLPYHIGNEISERKKLLLHTPASLRERFNIDVRIHSEVLAIDRESKRVSVKDLGSSRSYEEFYDYLILAPGATPFRPDIRGIDHSDIFSLRTIEDMDAILQRTSSRVPQDILIVGGGFIGLEMLEQLHARFHASKIRMSLVEMTSHVLAPLDPEMVIPIERSIRAQGITLITGDAVAEFQKSEHGVTAITKSGRQIPADFVLINIGVRPETTLASKAGIALGPRGGIKVDSELRTNDPSIFAVGDCIETKNPVTGEFGVTPLAGPANRQGRIVADVISGRKATYRGTLGTAIVRVFDQTAAVTGPNEKTLRRLKIPFEAVYLHPKSHAGYYPGAHPIHLKILYSPDNKKLLGAQAVGKDGVDKRIDVLATALFAGFTVDDLVDLELSYAPPFGSAKDPVNVAGMIAQNVQNNLVEIVSPLQLETESAKALLLDVRNLDERDKGYIPGSLHIPLHELRGRLSEIPIDKPLIVYCQTGQRSYNACRILLQHGFACKNLSGAFETWRTNDSR